MPGVYFVTTQEPITGQKTQVTAVFPGRNQSVAVKADNDRKMAEMSLPHKDKNVQYVDKPLSIITPAEKPPAPPCYPVPYYWNPYVSHAYFHHNMYHPNQPGLLPIMPYVMPPPYLVAPLIPWSTPVLPPIAMQQTEAEDEEDVEEEQPPRKLRDMLLIDDSVIRSMKGRDKESTRRFANRHQALRVVQKSPINPASGNKVFSSNNF